MNPQNSTPPGLNSTGQSPGLNDRQLVFGICLFLAAITWLVFGQTIRHDFVNFDDNKYIYENSIVQKGVTLAGLRWALTYGEIGHWHPLTWFTHMLDCQLYGLKAGGHHLTNVLLHTTTVILLFLVLRQMTGFLWRSAFVAAVFAIHPLRAESVAWIAERKDVLSGLFFVLTIGAYVRYVRQPPSKLRYGVVAGCFALGLLSKNMLVTTPFVLLLLDYWPLGRVSTSSPQVWLRLVTEKIPLFVLTALSCVATAMVPEKVPLADKIPLVLRMENAVSCYVTYLWQMIHPVGLTCLYLYPQTPPPLWQAGVSLGLILAITGMAYAFRTTRPWFTVGWFWYVGMMIPAIGIVQIAYYAHADRYTYLPQIGIYLALTWLAAETCAGWRHRRLVLGGGGTVILAGLMCCAHTQTAYWRDSEALWRHALTCTTNNLVAYNNLGETLMTKGNLTDAIIQFQQSLKINPNYVDAQKNLGCALAQSGRMDEAIAHNQQTLEINSNSVEAHNNLGVALIRKGNVDEAITQFQKVLQLSPGHVLARNNLGYALLLKGNVDEAITQLRKVLQLKSDYPEAHHNLADALVQKGQVDEAIIQYQQALQLNPDYLEAQNDLAWELATTPQASARNGKQAVALAERANQRAQGSDLVIMTTLAAAYAEAGRFKEAIQSARKAIELANSGGEQDQLAQLNSELKLYEAGQPYHRSRN